MPQPCWAPGSQQGSLDICPCVSSAPSQASGGLFLCPTCTHPLHPPVRRPAHRRVCARAQALTMCQMEGGLPGAPVTVNPGGRQGLALGSRSPGRGALLPPCTGHAVVSGAPTSPPRPGGSQSSSGGPRGGAWTLERLGEAGRGPRRKHPRRLQWRRSGGGLFTDVGRTWQGPWGWLARGQSGRPEHRCPGPGPGGLRNGRGRRLAPTCRTESLGPDSRRGCWPTALASEENREGSEGVCVCDLKGAPNAEGLVRRHPPANSIRTQGLATTSLVLRGSRPWPWPSTALCSWSGGRLLTRAPPARPAAPSVLCAGPGSSRGDTQPRRNHKPSPPLGLTPGLFPPATRKGSRLRSQAQQGRGRQRPLWKVSPTQLVFEAGWRSWPPRLGLPRAAPSMTKGPRVSPDTSRVAAGPWAVTRTALRVPHGVTHQLTRAPTAHTVGLSGCVGAAVALSRGCAPRSEHSSSERQGWPAWKSGSRQESEPWPRGDRVAVAGSTLPDDSAGCPQGGPGQDPVGTCCPVPQSQGGGEGRREASKPLAGSGCSLRGSGTREPGMWGPTVARNGTGRPAPGTRKWLRVKTGCASG